MLQKIFFIFVITVFVEIFLFIKIGQKIEWSWILIEIIFSFFLGSYLIKKIGFKIQKIRTTSPQKIMESIILQTSSVFSAIFLILPGFLTDFVGLILLIPQINILFRNQKKTSSFEQKNKNPSQEIKTSYKVLDD